MKRIADGKWLVCAGDVLADMIVPYAGMKRHIRRLAEGGAPDGPGPRPYRKPGGTSGNTAAALARLGVPTAVATRISGESFGRFLMADLKKHGLNTDFVVQEGEDNVMMIGVLDEEERVMFTWSERGGAYDCLLRGDLPDALVDVTGLAYISGVNVTSRSQQGEELTGYAERCKKAGAPVALDMNLRVETFGFDGERRDLIRRLVAASGIVFGSGVEEFGAVNGITDFEESVTAFAREHRDKIIVARNGALPAILVANGEKSSHPPLDVPVINKVGAGDSFNAGFLAAYYRGLDLKTAMKYGIACACHTISSDEVRGVPDETRLAELVAAQQQARPEGAVV